MRVAKTHVESKELAQLVVLGMQEKKALKITMLDLRRIKSSVTDFFVICSGTSDTHIDAIRNSVEEFVHKHTGEWPWQQEGLSQREWVLMDYSDVVIHIFKKEKREYYGIEDLWGDAEFEFIPDLY